MKNNSQTRFAILIFLIATATLFSWTLYKRPAPIAVAATFDRPITMCGTAFLDWEDSTITSRLLPGLGNLHYKISTKSEKAQQFFDQGIRLVYGFNHWEAVQSFREAIRQDPASAMSYWGLALALGPNLNDGNPADREKLAFEAIAKAAALKSNATEIERGLIEAMSKRYDGKVHAVRDTLNHAYADAMVALSKKYPTDWEIQTQTADAIMNTMPWNYWDEDGKPKPATTHAKTLLETVIKMAPQHAGAHHLYIHLVEASSNPDVALPSAKFLEDAMPGSGHLVHMPAHIYVRTGQYDLSIYQNQKAVIADEEYLAASENRGMYRWAYYPHNIDFISYSAYMEGRSKLGIETALKLAYKGSLISNSNLAYSQYLTAEPLHAYVRFGKWRDILSQQEPDDQYVYAQLITHFSKGLASLRTGNIKEAEKRLRKLDSLSQLTSLESFYFALNSAHAIAQVPKHILEGELLIRQNRIAEAVGALRRAVEFEDALRYNEPPDWKLPARQFLGSALYELGKYTEAEAVFAEDLQRNRENGWSLKGLLLTQEKLAKKKEAQQTKKRLDKAWRNADIELTGARF